MPVSDTRIFVSSVSRVHVSGDLACNPICNVKDTGRPHLNVKDN
jgi:hypothetical protein